ncbi:hypothetical protein DI005_06555 [Prauserella sp. PE36]|uniref:hypothetical protein n=1 Tax=Prauserella sp. PE36 TaxID=1504709 RepID=UPI000DE4983E|nr:hypothetical protein [Prauserella sp. PE36]RBM22476.1 hypothetical protein DI005_06555 [Prauserella sp. PE36]
MSAAVLGVMSPPRMANYLAWCGGDRSRALELYGWNSLASAAYWETLGHAEVALRNALAARLKARHQSLGRRGSWLDDPHRELAPQAAKDIAQARRRVQQKRKPASDGQTISELSFGFWRFLLAKQYNTTLWPDIASGFPNAPNRARVTVERPVVRLHDFRNRLAHHEPIWNKELAARQQDIYDLLAYLDPHLHSWVTKRCRISSVLVACPVARPHP